MFRSLQARTDQEAPAEVTGEAPAGEAPADEAPAGEATAGEATAVLEPSWKKWDAQGNLVPQPPQGPPPQTLIDKYNPGAEVLMAIHGCYYPRACRKCEYFTYVGYQAAWLHF